VAQVVILKYLLNPIKLYYECFPFVMSDEIFNRYCSEKKIFDEPELWYLTYTIISAANSFHLQERKVGDIRPQNIFINEDGQVKVANIFSWPD